MRSIAIMNALTLVCMMAVITTDASAQKKKAPVPRRDATFGLHFDFHATQYDKEIGADISEQNIRDLLSKVKPDFVQYDCKGHAGYTSYPTKVGTPSPGIVKDALPIWRKVTNELGIKLFIHYSGVLDGVAVQQHPEWARLDENGNSDGMTTSVFSSYVDDLMIPQLKEVVSAYNLDGLWVDGDCWGAKLDYSPAAVDAWKRETGYTDVPKHRGDPNWLEWKNFHRRHFESYLCHWVDELHKEFPSLEITSNWAYTSLMPKPPKANLDYLSGDYFPLNSLDSARFYARYIASIGKPWDLMAWGFNSVDGVGQTLKTPIQLQQEASAVIMQGGAFQIYYQPTRSGYIDNSIINTAAPVADFCRARAPFSRHNESVPQVALLFSTETWADLADGPYPSIGNDEISGAMHALLESHYSVDILPEFKLQPILNKYPLVVIADSYKLTDSFISAVTRYVEGGGSLLLLGEKCARLFEPICGVKFVGNPEMVSAEVVTSAGMVNENGVWQRVELAGARSIAYRYPFKNSKKDEDIAATVATYGNGKVAAIYGPVARNFFYTHHPYLRALIGDAAREVFPNPAVEIEGPACVDIALKRTADGRLSLHLLNTMNMQDSDRRIAFDYVPGIRNIKVKLSAKDKPKDVVWMPTGDKLKWEWRDGVLYTTIPELSIHGAIVLE